MISHIKVKERGATPGIMAKEWRKASKQAWYEMGVAYHTAYLPKRFTHEGAQELGYYKRKGEGLPKGSKAYRKSYTGRKEKKFGHTLPLVYTGETRQNVRLRDVRATSNGVKVVLNARKLNLRHPKSRINMAVEIRRVSEREMTNLAGTQDRYLNRELNGIRATKETQV